MVRHRLFALTFILSLAFSSSALAQTLFEGYAKVLVGNVHVGYSIQKYEFDSKKKQFKATTFLKTNEVGGNITESLLAVADENLNPISYKFTTLQGKTPKIIDAQFSKGRMNATVTDGGKKSTIKLDVPQGAFLSSFLGYMMLRSPTGLKADTRFEFQAIAEEDGSLEKGVATISTREDFFGIPAFKVMNDFKNVKFISHVSEKGEVFATRVPALSIVTELTATAEEATKGLAVPTAVIKNLFGEVPRGTVNALSERSRNPVPGKTQGIPGGQGMQLKGGAPAAGE
jgi:hypothetical protein